MAAAAAAAPRPRIVCPPIGRRRRRLRAAGKWEGGGRLTIDSLCDSQERSCLVTRVRTRVVRVRENLLISFFCCTWTGEGERKNNSKFRFTDPNHPILDSACDIQK